MRRGAESTETVPGCPGLFVVDATDPMGIAASLRPPRNANVSRGESEGLGLSRGVAREWDWLGNGLARNASLIARLVLVLASCGRPCRRKDRFGISRVAGISGKGMRVAREYLWLVYSFAPEFPCPYRSVLMLQDGAPFQAYATGSLKMNL